MKKHVPLLLLPMILILLAGIFYAQTGERRTLQEAELALANGDPARAGWLIASVAEGHPARWEQAGAYAFQSGDMQTAVMYFQNAVLSGQLSGGGYLLLGDAYLQLGEEILALPAWQTALDNGVPALGVHLRFLNVHRAAQDYSAAIHDLRAIIALSPDDAQARYQLGLLLATREPEAALSYLFQAVELDENLSQAVSLLQRSLRPSLETDDPAYTLLNAGRALAYLDEWELAAEAFSQAVEANPEYAEAWAFWGEAKEQTGQDGLAELDTALNLNPASLTANLLYALYQRRHGYPEVALVYLHAASALDPENPAIQVEIGQTLDLMGDFNAALEYYLRATELAPSDATYWHLLARFAYRNNTLVEEVGLAAARQALLLNKDDAVAQDLMGYGYYLLGDMATAERFLLQAQEMTPDAPEPILHLGLVALSRLDTRRAYDYLIQVLDMAPGSPSAQQAMRILEQYFP